MSKNIRLVNIDGVEVMTSLTPVELATAAIKIAELENKNSYLEKELELSREVNKEHQKLNGKLRVKINELEEQNFDIKQNLMIDKMSIPESLTKDKTFMEIMDMPSYEELLENNKKYLDILNTIIDYVYIKK